ncbi:GL21912 [Drosophila persimilis]|uniref:GL21912 n=1 Tax=Drosophila persimilis TaxID=7234 RepID=B4GE09_DROPE|nr:GL21912 [Drosophila persimilis]
MIETSIYRTNCVPLVMISLLIIDHRLIVVDSRVQALPKAMENKYLIRELSKETPEQMNIPVDHEQIVRLPSNSLLKYTSYKDVAILHFRVPPDSRAAYFTFKAFEESKNAFQRKCKVKDVTLHLKASSYPVISPENITFPKNFFSPEQRYVTMGLYCHGAETARGTIIDNIKEFVVHHKNLLKEMRPPCPCASAAKEYDACIKSPDCLAGMNETETFKVKECLMDYQCTSNYDMTRLFKIHQKTAMEEHIEVNNCNTSVVFSVSSSPCVGGRCGHFGRCYHYMSGGFVFSTCVCMKGYRGWDCTEDSQVPTNMSILLASLLLTLSNLIFVPSIYVALSRRYFTEGIIYFFAMFFSTFYHACDSGEDEYSFCLVKIGVLQFCDFYCGLLAIWVTLVAMADVRQQFASPLHMFGAILLAFGTELNKQSLWVFLAPALTGICLISTSWGFRCAKTRKMFPSRRYLTVWLPFGICLVCVGLVCYAFLQTKQNYHIVHSIWHIVMALSILCLLPSRSTAKC